MLPCVWLVASAWPSTQLLAAPSLCCPGCSQARPCTQEAHSSRGEVAEWMDVPSGRDGLCGRRVWLGCGQQEGENGTWHPLTEAKGPVDVTSVASTPTPQGPLGHTSSLCLRDRGSACTDCPSGWVRCP